MITHRISSTELKRETARVLNKVAFGNTEIIVERHGEPVAKITSLTKPKMTRVEAERVIKKHFGSLPDFPDVTKFRVSRKKFPTLD